MWWPEKDDDTVTYEFEGFTVFMHKYKCREQGRMMLGTGIADPSGTVLMMGDGEFQEPTEELARSIWESWKENMKRLSGQKGSK